MFKIKGRAFSTAFCSNKWMRIVSGTSAEYIPFDSDLLIDLAVAEEEPKHRHFKENTRSMKPNWGSSVAELNDGSVLLLGGEKQFLTGARQIVGNRVFDVFSSFTPLLASRRTAVCVVKDYLYVSGGINEFNRYNDCILRLDLRKNMRFNPRTAFLFGFPSFLSWLIRDEELKEKLEEDSGRELKYWVVDKKYLHEIEQKLFPAALRPIFSFEECQFNCKRSFWRRGFITVKEDEIDKIIETLGINSSVIEKRLFHKVKQPFESNPDFKRLLCLYSKPVLLFNKKFYDGLFRLVDYFQLYELESVLLVHLQLLEFPYRTVITLAHKYNMHSIINFLSS